MPTTSRNIVQICVAEDGRLWYTDTNNGDEPTITADEPGLLRSFTSREPLHLRLLGTVANVPFIAKVYKQYCLSGAGGKVELASPRICESASELAHPDVVLCRMRQCIMAGSLGGWHRMTDVDYATYAIAADLRNGFNGQVEQALKLHPIWRYLSFITKIDTSAVAHVLAALLDPRWFVDLENPSRLSRLLVFLGLDEKTVEAAMAGQVTNERSKRCHWVLRAWNSYGAPDTIEQGQPGNFLWRRWAHHGGGVRGSLGASRAFVCYLVRAWQQTLLATQLLGDFFLPEMLLRQDEVAALREHLSHF